jgi:NADH-quinone oxidoreductase subunit E
MTNPLVDPKTKRDLEAQARRDTTTYRTTAVRLDARGDASVFDEQTRAEAEQIIARYPAGQQRSALLPMLHLVQSVQGRVSPDGIAFCAEMLNLSRAQVWSVATYYTMFKRSPTGEYLVSVCTNTLCGMLGGDEIFAALKETLGLHDRERVPGDGTGPVPDGMAAAEGTTTDGTITLERAECLAACDYAPVLTVNYEYFDNQTVGSARNIVDQLTSGGRPTPTRGAPLCTFKQIERQIAGFFDEADFAPDAPSSGAPTEVGVKLAVERGESAPSYATRDGGGETGEEGK